MLEKYSKKKKIAIIVGIVVVVLIIIIVIVMATRPKKSDAPKKGKKKLAFDGFSPMVAGGGSTNNPKDLIKHAMKDIDVAMKNNTSILQKEANNDPKILEALKKCNNLLNNTNNDLKKIADKLDTKDIKNVIKFHKDFKRWIEGAINNQKACLDGCKKVGGNAGKKMEELLKKPMEATKNGQKVINGLTTFLPFNALGLGRRLLSVVY